MSKQVSSPSISSAKTKLPSSRLIALDLLRGYFLIVIMLNHLHYYPSGLEWITGESALYVSTAEGFFILSGIVLGLVRGRKLLDKPFKVARNLLLKRSLQLYITSVILVFLFVIMGQFFLDNPGLKFNIWELNAQTNWFEFIWNVVSLQYTYGWADYLRLYAVFILFSPIALWLLRKGLWYVVLAASVGVWMLYPYSPWPAGEYSQPFSWQLIFFVGFVIGYHLDSVRSWWNSLRKNWRTIATASIYTLALITLAINVIMIFFKDVPMLGQTAGWWDWKLYDDFNKDRLPIPRLILFSLWFSALLLLFTRFEKWLTKYLGWILLPFGTNSLYVYTIQGFVVFVVMLIVMKPQEWYINLLTSLVAVGIVYLAVRTKFLMKIIPR